MCVHIRLSWEMNVDEFHFHSKCWNKVSGHLMSSSPRGTCFSHDGDSITPHALPPSKLAPSPSCYLVWVSISNLSVKFVKYPWLYGIFAFDNFSKFSLNISSFFEHFFHLCPILLAMALGTRPCFLLYWKENFSTDGSSLQSTPFLVFLCSCIFAYVCVLACVQVHCVLVCAHCVECVYMLGCVDLCVSVGMHLSSLSYLAKVRKRIGS